MWLLKQEIKALQHSSIFKSNLANGNFLKTLAFVFAVASSAVPSLLIAVRQKPGQITYLCIPIQRKGTKVSESAVTN